MPGTREVILSRLLAGNRRFVAGTPVPRRLARERESLVAGQRPDAAVLACSDSRVDVEAIFDAPLGAVFAVETAGESVDFAVLGSLEYAVGHLGTSLLIVMGHDHCGAVNEAFGRDTPAGALGAVVTQLRKNIIGASSLEQAVVMNAKQAAKRLIELSEVLRGAVEHGKLAIVPAHYHLADGSVELLT